MDPSCLPVGWPQGRPAKNLSPRGPQGPDGSTPSDQAATGGARGWDGALGSGGKPGRRAASGGMPCASGRHGQAASVAGPGMRCEATPHKGQCSAPGKADEGASSEAPASACTRVPWALQTSTQSPAPAPAALSAADTEGAHTRPKIASQANQVHRRQAVVGWVTS